MTKIRSLLMLIYTILTATAGVLVTFWFLDRHFVIKLFPYTIILVPVSSISILLILLAGIFTITMYKGNSQETFISGAKYGLVVGGISVILQLIHWAGLAVQITAENITLVSDISLHVERTAIAGYILAGVNICFWVILFGGGGVLALNALRHVVRVRNSKASSLFRNEVDWGSALISLSVFVIFLIVIVDSITSSRLVLSILVESISLTLLSLSITFDFLLAKENIKPVSQNAVIVLGILNLLALASLGIYSYFQQAAFISEEELLSWVAIYVFLILLWIPRYITKLTGDRYQKLLYVVSIWYRIVITPIPLCFFLSVDFPSALSVWLISSLSMVELYFIYVGLIWFLSTNARFQIWMSERIPSTRSVDIDTKTFESPINRKAED